VAVLIDSVLFCLLSVWDCQQHNALSLNGSFSSHGIDLFARLGFHTDLRRREVQEIGQPTLDGPLVRTKFGSFGKDNAVEIHG